MFLSERSIASATCSPSSMIAKYCFPPLRPRGQFKSSKFLRCCLHNNPDPGHGTTNLPSLWGALFSQSSNTCFIVYRRHSPRHKLSTLSPKTYRFNHRVSYFTFNLNVNALVSYHATSV